MDFLLVEEEFIGFNDYAQTELTLISNANHQK